MHGVVTESDESGGERRFSGLNGPKSVIYVLFGRQGSLFGFVKVISQIIN